MKNILLILLIFSSNLGIGQNLVPNPSFEVYDACPTNLSNSGDFQLSHATGWYAPTLGTTDYFNTCSGLAGGANIPNTGPGYQTTLDGNGFSGILLQIEDNKLDWFEYAQAKLTSPLIQGYSYKVSFNVNLADDSHYAVQKIGAWISSDPLSQASPQPMPIGDPLIVNTNGFLTDASGWTKIEGEFIANGGEEYITLGYYSDTTAADTLRTSVFADPTSIYSYYYIDGVEVSEVDQSVLIPNVFTPNDDGINDVFSLKFPTESTAIYNRWGVEVFSSTDGTLWDGKTASGIDVKDGTYYYIISTTLNTYSGFIQLTR